MTVALCPQCQSPLRCEAPGGYCPRCAGRLLLGLSPPPDAAADAPAPEASVRLGEYELGAELGRGAMGVVYRARQPRLKREVAVKVILASRFVGEAARKRFLAEAELAAQLDHPNIVPIYEVGETEDGPFYAMKLVEGGTLDSVAASRQSASNCAAPAEVKSAALCRDAATLLAKLARAVQHAHERGVLHRDLKPGNILLDANGEPHITDFGLARQLGAESSLTLTGATLGTPAYMSPEQAAGERGITTATDVWSLGAILFHLLTGRPPFNGATGTDVLLQVRTQEPPRLRSLRKEIPADLETICLKCLEKDPARRYTSARRLAEDLERWQRHEPIEARPVSPVERLGKWARRKPAVAALVGALHIAALVGVVGIAWQWRRAEFNAQQARARLLQTHLVNVQHAFTEGDPLNALPWLASALQLQTPLSPQRPVYELSFASALRTAVLPERMWFLPRNASATLSADGEAVAAYSADETVMVWRVDTGEPLVARGTMSGAWTLVWSPDGRRLVVGNGDGARLYELPSGREVAQLGHGAPVAHAHFSPDARWVATESQKVDVRVWSAEDGQPVTAPLPHAHLIGDVQFGPKGRLLTVDRERAMILWEVPAGREVRRREGEFFWKARLSADGRRVVASVGSAARSYDGETLQPLGQPMPHAGLVTQVCFSPDGASVLTASEDGTARVWDAATGEVITPPLVHHLEVNTVVFSPDGRAVATGSRDATARVWDAATGQPLTPWLRHGGLVNTVAFTPDGRRLVSSSDDGVVRVWRLGTPSQQGLSLVGLTPPIKSAWANDDATQLVTRDASNRVRCWSAETGQPLNPTQQWHMAARYVRFSPDGRQILLADETNVWQQEIRVQTNAPVIQPHLPATLHIEWHPDGQSFFTASDAGYVVEWDAAARTRRRDLPRGEPLTSLMRVSRDGKTLAGACESRVAIWKLNTGERRVSGEIPGAQFRLVRFSPNGRLLAAGAAGGTVGLLNTETAAWLAGPLPHPGWILDLDFSPDNRQLAVVAYDGMVRLRDAHSGQLLGSPLRVAGGVHRGRFSPDGRLLGTVSTFTSQIWDVATRVPVTPLFRFSHRVVEGPVFSPDSRSVFFVTEDAQLIRHRLESPDWPPEIWQIASRFLSSQALTESGSLELWQPGPDADHEWQRLRERLVAAGLAGNE